MSPTETVYRHACGCPQAASKALSTIYYRSADSRRSLSQLRVSRCGAVSGQRKVSVISMKRAFHALYVIRLHTIGQSTIDSLNQYISRCDEAWWKESRSEESRSEVCSIVRIGPKCTIRAGRITHAFKRGSLAMEGHLTVANEIYCSELPRGSPIASTFLLALRSLLDGQSVFLTHSRYDGDDDLRD